MPKLFQINVCVNLSTGKIAQLIGESALSHGWESWIAYSSRQATIPSHSQLIKVGSKYDSYFHYIENYILDREGLGSKRATFKLVEEIKRVAPDIVQIHNIHDHWLNYRILFEYLNQTDIKVVWTFHDCWAFTGHCFHPVLKGCEKWKSQCVKCPLQKIDPVSCVDRSNYNFNLKKQLFGSNKNLTIVPCSEWMAGFVRDSFLGRKNIQVIHNGIDLDVFKPHEANDKDYASRYRVLGVSNVWCKDKGLEDVFLLRKLLPDEYEITLVGLTPNQIKKIPKGINAIPRTQNVEQLVDIYASSDVFINPTYADTFPTVNIESIACGLPVVTYQTGGSPEIIDDNTGIVVEQGNIQRMANAIVRMKDCPLDRVECRNRAVSHFDKNRQFEKYIALYNNLLGI